MLRTLVRDAVLVQALARREILLLRGVVNAALAAILMVAFPALASAWTFPVTVTNTTAGINAGNKATVTIGTTSTVVTTGTKYFYPANTVTTVYVDVANLPNVTSITLDNIVQPIASPVVVEKGIASAHSLKIVYSSTVAQTRNITVTQASGGLATVRIGTASSTSGFTNVAVGTSVTVVAQPNTGSKLKSLKINGVEQAVDAARGLGSTSPVTTTFQVDSAFSPNTVTSEYDNVPSITALLTVPPQAAIGTAALAEVTASSNVSPLNYDFTTTCSAQVQNGPASTFSFTPVAQGTCSVSVTVTGPGGVAATSKTASVNVVSGVDNENWTCLSCHNSSSPAIVSEYNSSAHYQKTSCQGCHTSSAHEAAPSGSVCASCHTDNGGAVPNHPVEIGTSACTFCHSPHSVTAGVQGAPHFNNITGGIYPASYVTSRNNCASCHADAINATIRHEWAQSAHGATTEYPWMANDFKTMSGCVQCHTTTGFIAYSTGRITTAWGIATDKTKEVLACIGCHTDLNTGAIRTVSPVRPYADDSYTNPNVGKSNVCMDCHSGRKNGASISILLEPGSSADFSNLAFIDPHYLAAGGTMYGKAGYHFPGRTYNSDGTHIRLGSLNGSGPCVSCHKNSTNGHTFKTGAVAECAACHGSSLTTVELSAAKAAFADLLEVLRAQLVAKGYVYSPVEPHFSATNWGSGQAGANTMGAAFNYAMLLAEPGAYAHDPTYARQLALDSIDFLDNGQVDGTVNSLAVPALLDTQAISAAAAASTVAIQTKNNCILCHGGNVDSGMPMATNAHDAHLTSQYGPGNFLGTGSVSCQTCHPFGAAHVNGQVDTLNGPGSTCAACHPGSIPSWTATARLDCVSCHAAVPSILPGNIPAPYKAGFGSSGHGRFAGSNQCTDCHDPASGHISGSMGDGFRLRLPNDQGLCSSCHNDASKITDPRFRNMSTTHAGKTCLVCHDPHGTANTSMIRTTLNMTSITFSGTNYIQTSPPYRGLCQVCHTLTDHYRAGVNETDHPTSNCIGCHPHTSPGEAFKPIGGACDTCHGYPPAPKNVALSFGTTGLWEGARYEDYSGGVGAHLVAQHVSPNEKPSEGWSNCTVCHNGGNDDSAPYHVMTTPVSSHISNVTVQVDHRLRFSNAYIIYTGARLVDPPALNATGSCFNINCHMTASPRWSSER